MKANSPNRTDKFEIRTHVDAPDGRDGTWVRHTSRPYFSVCFAIGGGTMNFVPVAPVQNDEIYEPLIEEAREFLHEEERKRWKKASAASEQ